MRRNFFVEQKPDGLMPAHSQDCPLKEAFKMEYGKLPACFVNANYGVKGVKKLRQCVHYAGDLKVEENGAYTLECKL